MRATSTEPSWRASPDAPGPRNAKGAQTAKRVSSVDRKQFEQLVAEALASVPRRFRDAMKNIAIVVEDEPASGLLEEMGIAPPDTLLGLYQGTPLTERTWGYGNALPDRVLIFQGPHERDAEDEDDLVVAIGETLIHEIGHYFGLSEEEIQEIEEKYWRGEE
jgi:predicted Zn-dependent protease with MMP-like domain